MFCVSSARQVKPSSAKPTRRALISRPTTDTCPLQTTTGYDVAPAPQSIPRGEVTEWSNVAVSKTVVPLRVPRVRIPVSPPYNILISQCFLFWPFLSSCQEVTRGVVRTVSVSSLIWPDLPPRSRMAVSVGMVSRVGDVLHRRADAFGLGLLAKDVSGSFAGSGAPSSLC